MNSLANRDYGLLTSICSSYIQALVNYEKQKRTGKQQNQISDLAFHLFYFHRFSPFNQFTAIMSLKTTNKSAKFQILKPFCLLFRTGE